MVQWRGRLSHPCLAGLMGGVGAVMGGGGAVMGGVAAVVSIAPTSC
jgi:hypothetical protein